MELLSDRLLCKKVNNKKDTKGIILPTNQTETFEYEVIQVGLKVKKIKVGDIVKKHKFADGTPIILEGKNYLILRENTDIEFVLY